MSPVVNQIVLEGADLALFKETSKASAAITPGDVIEDGGANDIQRHSTADANAERRFAVESTLMGVEPAGLHIDRDYATGETVREAYVPSGALIYAWLAAGENVAKGAELSSDGAGKLQAYTAPSLAATSGTAQGDAAVARAAEAVNNTAGTVPVRIKVRAI